MTLVCEEANSILVDVFTVDGEKGVDNSLAQIWKLKFGHEAIFCSDLKRKVWSRS